MVEKPTYEEAEKALIEKELIEKETLFRGLFDHMTSGSAVYEVRNDGSKGPPVSG